MKICLEFGKLSSNTSCRSLKELSNGILWVLNGAMYKKLWQFYWSQSSSEISTKLRWQVTDRNMSYGPSLVTVTYPPRYGDKIRTQDTVRPLCYGPYPVLRTVTVDRNTGKISSNLLEIFTKIRRQVTVRPLCYGTVTWAYLGPQLSFGSPDFGRP